MWSKISPLAAVAAVAFAIAPALALDNHFVPVPTETALPEALPSGDKAADAAPALPSDIPWPDLNSFPHGAYPGAAADKSEGAAGNASIAGVTASTYTTWCPDPTVLTWGSSTISVTEPAWVTLTDCPPSSSSSATATETGSPVVPSGKGWGHPHPGFDPEASSGHEGEHGSEGYDGSSAETTAEKPINPPHTVAPVVPTNSGYVIVSAAAKTQQGAFLLGVAAAALGLAVFGL